MPPPERKNGRRRRHAPGNSVILRLFRCAGFVADTRKSRGRGRKSSMQGKRLIIGKTSRFGIRSGVSLIRSEIGAPGDTGVGDARSGETGYKVLINGLI